MYRTDEAPTKLEVSIVADTQLSLVSVPRSLRVWEGRALSSENLIVLWVIP